MNAMIDKDYAAQTGELAELRAQIAKLADRLSHTAHQSEEVARGAQRVGRRAWATAEDEAELLLRRVEGNPVASAAVVIGVVGLILGLLFASRS